MTKKIKENTHGEKKPECFDKSDPSHNKHIELKNFKLTLFW